MKVNIEKSWAEQLSNEFDSAYFSDLTKTVKSAYLSGTPTYPPAKQIFSAFELCPFDKVKVVILGQDPYHGEGQAHGLSFSVPDGTTIPPSLKNIYKEIQADLGIEVPSSGNLERWATQGVLLLNATLTVAGGQPGSHQGLGWETFTDAVIKKISAEKSHVVFLLWGKYAQAKADLIDGTKHLILKAPHPSPFSAYTGFFGCRHFSKTNEYLKDTGQSTIDW
jgi:uracil-DNA glycosylase